MQTINQTTAEMSAPSVLDLVMQDLAEKHKEDIINNTSTNDIIGILEAKLADFVAEREKLEAQVEDLENAEASLENAIAELKEVPEDLRNK